MKILLIGNGFDLAHKLPTTYNDFLEVCKGLKSELTAKPVSNTLFVNYSANVSKIDRDRLRNIIKNNAWIEHFINKRNKLGDSWGDFETEVESVVKNLYEEMNSSAKDTISSCAYQILYRTIRNKYTDDFNNSYNELFKKLIIELKELSNALDIYFVTYVEKISIQTLELFKNKGINRLLSFNYTSTFTENYNAYDVPDFESCYIHGKTSKNNLVLGFDDHYLESGNAIIKTVPFEKYYQRIVNVNDNTYLKWLEELKESSEISELIIFGHSLTPSDGDILRKFICCPNVITKIYCYNDDDRARKIANLAFVLGPDRLISFVGELNPIVEFLPQKTL